VDGYAATVAPDGGWWSTLASPSAAAARTAAASAGAGKVWLDEIAEVSLAESTPMVGAPQAWAAGYDGSGMTVAVLDTGIDPDHPDVAGQIADARNFTTEADTRDGHGHGTHVASTVAGTGAGSEGTYTGVAPGADLLVGKICTSAGTCPNSATIAGMEWAAPIADVVSMSIGSNVGNDGTAPTALAVNRLTAQHDTLFVVAAANNGPQPGSVGSPGAADAALTVGAVNKDGELAGFSSRGPRLGDFVIKPDITAPGVGIAAARAAGTSMGTPVNDLYTRANGTSMATPHVAGAAAIVLQQDPDLGAAELKAALAGTATPNPDLTVYQQGGGLVDIPAALAAPVLATPAPLNLGFFPYPQADLEPVEQTVTYTNRTDAPVALDLALAVTGPDGTPVSTVSVDPATVTVPAGGTATATVTADVTGLPVGSGSYGGYLVATGVAGAVRTPVGFHLEQEMYDVAITGIARDGRPARGASSLFVADAVDTGNVRTSIQFVDGVARLRVTPGSYWIGGTIRTYDGNNVTVQDRVFVGVPTLDVTEDTALVLDAREAKEVTIDTPANPDATPHGQQSRMLLRFKAAVAGSYGATYVGEWARTFVLESDPVRVGTFEFTTNARLAAPRLALAVVEPTATELFARPLAGPPPLDDDLRLPLVFAGAGAESDYADLDATGAAVLTLRDGPALPAKEATARAHGAAALLVMNNATGWFTGSVGSAAELPSMAISGEEGAMLRDLLAEGDVTVRVAGTAFSPYLYETVYPEPDRFPDGGRYVAEPAQLATVNNTIHGVPGHTVGEYRALWRPGDVVGAAQYTETPVAVERVEYVSPGDSLYRQTMTAAYVTVGTMNERDIMYEVGDESHRAWFKSPMHSGLYDRHGPRNPGDPVVRTGNQIRFVQPAWFDNNTPAGYGAFHASVDTTPFRAYRNGVLFGTAPRPQVLVNVGPEPATYRFEVDLTRTAEWWPTTTAVHTAWTFASGAPPDGETEILPLLQASYDVELDLTNTAPHPRDSRSPATLGLRVAHQNGAQAPAIAGARVWISYDDGATWEPRPVRDLGDGAYRSILNSPDPADTPGFLSLRVEAWDADGNRIEQEILRAWQLPPR
ncbi:MAG: S8 family serine peptidase, partial [Natronosporangium sp.]